MVVQQHRIVTISSQFTINSCGRALDMQAASRETRFGEQGFHQIGHFNHTDILSHDARLAANLFEQRLRFTGMRLKIGCKWVGHAYLI